MQELEAKETQLKMSLGQLTVSMYVAFVHWLYCVDSSGAEKKLAEIEIAKNKKVTTHYPQLLFDTMPLLHRH